MNLVKRLTILGGGLLFSIALQQTASTVARADWLPERVDLSADLPPPGWQGSQGSAVAWAVSYARAYYVKSLEGRDNNRPENIPSPSYIYNAIVKDQACDAGIGISDALNLLQNSGSASLRDDAYDQGRCDKPSPEVISRSSGQFKIESFLRLGADRDLLDDIKGELAQKNPVILAIATTPIFDRFRGDGIYDQHPSYLAQNHDGSHAMTVVGYDERKQAFRLINSWGRRWGDNGFIWISYETLRNEVGAAYVMRPRTEH